MDGERRRPSAALVGLAATNRGSTHPTRFSYTLSVLRPSGVRRPAPSADRHHYRSISYEPTTQTGDRVRTVTLASDRVSSRVERRANASDQQPAYWGRDNRCQKVARSPGSIGLERFTLGLRTQGQPISGGLKGRRSIAWGETPGLGRPALFVHPVGVPERLLRPFRPPRMGGSVEAPGFHPGLGSCGLSGRP